MVKISIIIPMYNVEQYIEKCIVSTYNQGFSENEFELILVDDESPDNSLALVTDIAKNYSNMTIISQKNKGLGGARNTGIQNAKGQYLLFLDADDYVLPNKLNETIAIAVKNNLDILEFGSQGVSTDGQITYEVSRSTNGTIYNGVDYYNILKYMNSACNKLYKRDMLLKHNILFIEKIYIEDFEFNTRAFFFTKRVMGINKIVAHYLQSPDSITRNTSKEKKEKMLNDLIKVLKLTKQFGNQSNSDNSLATKTYFETRLSFININIFYQLFKNGNSYSKIKAIKEQLEKEQLFYVKRPVYDKNKDLFRKYMLHNFWLFKITQPLQKLVFK